MASKKPSKNRPTQDLREKAPRPMETKSAIDAAFAPKRPSEIRDMIGTRVIGQLTGRRTNAVFCGPTGSGKTEIWRTLEAEYPGLIRDGDGRKPARWKMPPAFLPSPSSISRQFPPHGRGAAYPAANKHFKYIKKLLRKMWKYVKVLKSRFHDALKTGVFTMCAKKRMLCFHAEDISALSR